MQQQLVARASIDVAAPAADVWQALVDPELVRQYMFGTQVETDWKVGSTITWRGEWKGRAYEDRGKVLRNEPGKVLEYTHVSPRSGRPERPEEHHTVTVALHEEDGVTRVSLSQDNNEDPEAREHAEANWAMMLRELKRVVET